MQNGVWEGGLWSQLKYRSPSRATNCHTAALLHTTTLCEGETLTLDRFLSKMVVFSSEPPWISIGTPMWGSEFHVTEGSIDSGWLFESNVWCGGENSETTDYFPSWTRLGARSNAVVVYEYVMSEERREAPSVFTATHRHMLYDADDYGSVVRDTVLDLDEMPLETNDVSERITDTIVWSDSTLTASMSWNKVYPLFSINEFTSRAVRTGYFGQVTSGGRYSYNTGVMNSRRFETAEVHVTRRL
jgi:hypothetical protein